jgi:hypothetical protein
LSLDGIPRHERRGYRKALHSGWERRGLGSSVGVPAHPQLPHPQAAESAQVACDSGRSGSSRCPRASHEACGVSREAAVARFRRTNRNGTSRSLTGADRNSRRNADFPRGSLDMTRCSDMLDQPESIVFTALFGFRAMGRKSGRVNPSGAVGVRADRALVPETTGRVEPSGVSSVAPAAHGLQPVSSSGFLEC